MFNFGSKFMGRVRNIKPVYTIVEHFSFRGHDPVVAIINLFFEIIQRKGAKSFGAGNFKALFEELSYSFCLKCLVF